MRRVVGVVTGLFWVNTALWAVLVALSWAAPALLEERFFLNLSGASVGLARSRPGSCFGRNCVPAAKSCATFGGRIAPFAWKRGASGPPKRGSTEPPAPSPSSSRGTCCQPCSWREPQHLPLGDALPGTRARNLLQRAGLLARGRG